MRSPFLFAQSPSKLVPTPVPTLFGQGYRLERAITPARENWGRVTNLTGVLVPRGGRQQDLRACYALIPRRVAGRTPFLLRDERLRPSVCAVTPGLPWWSLFGSMATTQHWNTRTWRIYDLQKPLKNRRTRPCHLGSPTEHQGQHGLAEIRRLAARQGLQDAGGDPSVHVSRVQRPLVQSRP